MKMRYRERMKKALALILCAVMLMGNLPTAMAASMGDTTYYADNEDNGVNGGAPAQGDTGDEETPSSGTESTPANGTDAQSEGDGEGDGEEEPPVQLNPMLSVGTSADPAGDATANAEGAELRFTALPTLSLVDGEALPEDARIVYTYTWQYAQRKFTTSRGQTVEQALTEDDWIDGSVGGDEYLPNNGGYNPLYGAWEEDAAGVDAGKVLVLPLPAGADRRTTLSKMAVRCVVTAKVMQGENCIGEAEAVMTDRTNITVASSLLECALSGEFTEYVALRNNEDTLSYTVTPALANAPVDSGNVTYTYTWEYYDASRSRWRTTTSSTSLKSATITSGASSTLSMPLPQTVADRAKLEGLQVRCSVTATVPGGYTVTGSISNHEFTAVTVDESLLTYTLAVESDNSGATVTGAGDTLTFKVTPTLYGAASTYSSYTYDWQYYVIGSGWTTISRSDASCPLRYATSTSGASSTLSMALPENVETRKTLNGVKVRCVVSAGGVTPAPDSVESEIANINIPRELLTEFSLNVTEDASNNTNLEYPGQVLRLMYIPTVGGMNADEAVLKYNWSFKGKNDASFAPLDNTSGALAGAQFIEDENGNVVGIVFDDTNAANRLKAIAGGTIRCEIELYANGDVVDQGGDYELDWSRDAVITVDEAFIEEYEGVDWIANAWLAFDPSVKGDIIEELGGTATLEITARLDQEYAGDALNEADKNSYQAILDGDYYNGLPYKHVWEYRQNENDEWKPLSQLEAIDQALFDSIEVEYGDNLEKAAFSKLTVTLPESYAARIRLSGMQFRCVSTARVLARHTGDPDVPWGVISGGSDIDPNGILTIVVNPKLLHSQVSSTRRITGFLTKEEADAYLALSDEDKAAYDPTGHALYDYNDSYMIEFFEDGVREDRATANFPESIVAVYEYQEETSLGVVETKTAAIELQVPWLFIMQNGKQYDLNSTKAQYRYDAVLTQTIPQMNAEELQKYIDEHPDPTALDYDEDDAVKWVLAASLNGRLPHIKVCWNTELRALASAAEISGAPINPYWKETFSDWYFTNASDLNGDAPSGVNKTTAKKNEAMSEAAQLAWLNENYSTVTVLMDDVRSDDANAAPIVLELPVTWTKYTVDEYDAASQSMTNRWMGDAATGNIQGVRAAAANWVWRATINAVEDGQYVLADALRYNAIEANIYWSLVIDQIIGALVNVNDADTTSILKLANASAFAGKIPTALKVELKNANGGINILETVPVSTADWKIIEGSVYDASQQYKWRHLDPDQADIVAEVGTTAPAGFVAIEPTLNGYTFTQNADTEQARVWYQWGTIITGLKKSDGTDFDAVAAAKTPIIRVPTIEGSSQSVVAWANLTSTTYLGKTFNVEIMDKSVSTGFSTSTVKPTWVQPSNYDASSAAARIQPAAQFEDVSGGRVFSEELNQDLNGREVYGEVSWKINVPEKTSGSTSFIIYNVVSNQPHITGAAGEKTVYADRVWECYYKASASSDGGTQKTTNFATNLQNTWQDAGESVKYMVNTAERGGGAFVEYNVTFRNDSTGTRYVGLSYGSDVQIHTNDKAPLTVTNTGIKMEESAGDMCQFNINTTTATAGISVSADGYWIGVYSARQHWQSTITGDLNVKTNASGEKYVTGIDSGLTFSWIPQRHPLAPGESVTFTCQFGVGKMSQPPRIVPHYDGASSSTNRSTNVTMNGSNLEVSAWLAGESQYQMTLYYILDEGLPTEQNEASLGGKVTPGGVVSNADFLKYSEAQKTAYYRTSTSGHFVEVTGTIEKPRDWVAGEYHSITLYGMSDAGLITDSVRFPLYVTENDDGEEIFAPATEATVSYAKGSVPSGTINGTVPESQTAHLQEPVQLPKGNTLSASNGYKFVGWDYQKEVKTTNADGTVTTTTKTVTYPAESYFYVEKHPTTLTAKWIPSSQTMYLLETYVQNSAGEYEQGDTEVRIDTGTGSIVFTPEDKVGYTVNTAKSTLTVARADGATIKVYYDINKYPVVYDLNGAPGGDENGVFKTVEVAYGSNVSGVPTSAALNAGQNNNFFHFVGWFDTAADTGGNLIDTDTVVDETTLDTTDEGGKLVAYARWRPLGNAQITFDYNYQNHAQGAVRSEKRSLNPVFNGTGKYGYGSTPSSMPSTPSAWKDTEGKVYTFLEWRLVVDGEISDTVVTRDTELPNYENVTVKAMWTESYSVSRSYQGDGTIWDINDPSGGERSYAPGDTIEIRWRANTGSYVQHVYIDNVLCDELIKNGGWRLEDVHENHSVYVVFAFGDGDSGIVEETTYNITATPVGGIAFDVPERGGTYKAEYGEDYTVKWRVSPGYSLTSVTVNGLPMDISDIQNTNSYTFNNIHLDQEIKVTAVRDGSTTSSGSTINRGPYTVTTKIARGTQITPNQTVAYGDSCTVTWKVPYGFVVDSVLINRVPLSVIPEDNSYVFRNVTLNSSIVVMCKPDPNLPDDTVFVTTTIDENGTITPTTPVGQLSKGDNHTVTWSADSGYYVSAVYIDNVLQKTASGANKIFYSYTFTNIQESHDVVVEVSQASTGGDTPGATLHAITTSMVNGGTIDQPGSVPDGSDVTVTWRMAANHRVVAVYLDDELVDDYNADVNGNSYTISDVTAAHTLRVECERIVTPPVDMTDKFIVTTKINLGAADGQKIVESGASCTVNWTPPSGYHVSSLKVNGVAQAYVDGNSWTIGSVTENTTVDVTVEKDSEQNYKIVPSIVNGGTVTGGGTMQVGMGAVLRWTVADGFRVTDVNIDGVSVTGIDLENDRSYTFPASKGQPGETYNFNVVCAPMQYYHVRPTGTGVVDLSASADPFLGDSYTVSWSVADKYRFVSATVNGTEVTPQLNSGVYSYTFDSSNTAANGTYNLVVTCEKIPSYTITTGRNSGGIVSESKTIYDTDAEKSYTVTWSASSGYRVKAVTVDGVAYTGENFVFNYDDGRDVTLRVEFEPQKYYTVNATGRNTGITEGNGTYTIDTDSTVKWTAPEGFELTSITIDGTEIAFTPNQTEYTFDHTEGLTAGHTYNMVVTYAAQSGGGDTPIEPDEYYSIDTTGTFTASISDDATKKLGEDYTVEWTVLDGYQLDTVKVDGQIVTNYSAANGTYSLTISGADKTADQTVTVEVVCKRIGSGQPGGGGSVITPYSVYAYSNDESLGTVTPGSATLRAENTSTEITWAAKEYCHVVSVTISDYPDRSNPVSATEAQLAAGKYTFLYNGHKDKIVDVVFEADPEYTVTASAAGNVGEGCTVQVSGADPLKKTGDTGTVTWNVGSGYRVDSILVADADGSNAVSLDAAAIALGSLVFKYEEMSASRNVTVTFAKNSTGGGGGGTGTVPYTVRAQVNDAAMGTVSPTVKTLTAAGSTADVTWTANSGYHVKSVTVSNYPDGGEAHTFTEEELTEGKYTFAYDDNKDKLVNVEFEQDPMYEISTEAVGGGANSSVSGGATLTASGQTHMVTWSAGSGYSVKSVVITDANGSNAQALSADDIAKNSYTFEYDNMTADRKVTVTFQKDTSGGGGGSAATVYSVTTSVNDGSMGWVSPSADLRAEGATYQVNWGANDGYSVKSVTVDGRNYEDSSYTFAYSDHKDITVYVEFEKLPEFVITTEKVGGGANSTVREGTTLTRSGETYAVTWSADSAFKVQSVVITDADGRTVKTLTDAEIAAGKYTFAYDDMTSDQKITVTFETDTSSGGGSGTGTTPYSVTTQVVPADESMGTIDPSKTLRRADEEYNVTWSAKPGYRVKSVTIGSDVYTLENNDLPTDYTFKYNDEQDITVSVEFEQIPQYVITAEMQGNGGANSTVSSGTTLTAPGQTHTVTWAADEGYVVRSVVISKPNGTDRITLTDEEKALGSYTFAYDDMTSDRKIVVTFEKDASTTPGGGEDIPATPYTVTTSVNDETMGTVSPSKTLRDAGAEYEITWSANDGYYVKSVSVDGKGYAPSSYTFKYDEHKDIAVKVTFAPNDVYTATAVKVGGGANSTVQPESGTLSKSGDTHTVTWSPDAGYKTASAVVTNAKGSVVWTCDETEIANGTYTFSYDEMTSDRTITVTFVKDSGGTASDTPYAINTSVNDSSMGWVDPSVTLRTAGTERDINWGTNDGYRVKSVSITAPDGSKLDPEITVDPEDGKYTFKYDDKQDLALYVEFEPVPAYTVTAEKVGGGANSTVQPASAELNKPGDSQTVTWSADTGYVVKSVVINDAAGTQVESLDAAAIAAGGYTFNYDDIDGDRTIVVTFEKDSNPGGLTPVPHAVSTSKNGEGTVSPSKSLSNAGEEYTVEWAASAGWHVASVTIDGENLTGDDIPENYVFKYDEGKDVQVIVTFEENVKRVITTAKTGTYGLSTVSDGATLNLPDSEHTVTWTVDDGYSVQSVVITDADGSEIETLTAEEIAAGSYTFAYNDMTSDQTITVEYAKETAPVDPDDPDPAPVAYTIVTGSNDASGTMGTITAGATVRKDSGDHVVTWSANPGYNVKAVTYKIDGELQTGAPDSPYTFNYDFGHDVEIYVEFERNAGRTVNVNPVGSGTAANPKTMYIVGDSYTVWWMPNDGSEVDTVTVSGYAPLGTSKVLDEDDWAYDEATGKYSYTFKYDEMTADATIDIVFKDKDYYYVTTSAQNADITATPDKCELGESSLITWTPVENTELTHIRIDGVEQTITDKSITSLTFTPENPTANKIYLIEVIYELKTSTGGGDTPVPPEPDKFYTVNVIPHFTATCTESASVKLGENFAVDWTVLEGYEFDHITVNGSELTDFDGSTGSYSYMVLGADREENEVVTVEIFCTKIEGGSGDTSYTVSTGKSGNGEISPSRTLTSGEYEVTWKPAEGWHIAQVTYDPADVASDVQANGDGSFTYTFKYDDGADVEIFVEFEQDPAYVITTAKAGTYGPNTTVGSGATLTGAGQQHVVTWFAGEGYQVARVIDSKPDGTDARDITETVTDSYTYYYNDISSDRLLTVTFEKITETDPDVPPVYSIITSVNDTAMGSIDAGVTLDQGDDPAEITWQASEGYRVKSVTHTIDGTVQTTEPTSPYTFSYGHDEEIYVEFEAMPEYRVNVSKEGSGTAAGAGVIKYDDADAENHIVTWAAEEGWHVSKVVVGSGRLSDADAQSGRYIVKYSELTGDVSIKVVFERDQVITPPTPENSFTVSTDYEGNGTINDGATLREDSEPYTVTWAPSEGWHVKSAQLLNTDDGTLLDTLTGNSYEFSYSVGENVTVKVVFEKDAEYSITAVIDAGGTITPTTAVLSKGDDPCEVTWTVSDSDRFSINKVTLNGTALDEDNYTKADGSFGYTFDYDELFAADMPENIELKVELNEAAQPPAPVQYLVSTQLTPNGAGSITGAAMVTENGSYTVNWAAGSEYRVTKVEITENGATREITAADSGSYSFETISSNCAIVVTCEERPKIDLGGDDVFYDIITGISGGTMDDGKTVRSVRKGDSYTVSWAPDLGFYIESVIVDGAVVPVCTEYTFSDIDSDHTVQVNCLSTAVSEIYYVNITDGGAITNGSREVQVGTDHTVTWKPADGEHIVSVTVNGNPVDIGDENNGGSYTVTGAEKDDVFNIVITCAVNPPVEEEEIYYDVAVTVKNATVSGETHIKAGESTTISWEPEFGYEIKSIIIDDSTRPVTLEEFTFENMASDHSVIVICERIGSVTPDPEAEYTISTHITDGGTITPPITVKTADEKQSQTVTWSAPEGFRVVKVKIDNTERGDLVDAGTVTFNSITGNHSVDVECERIVTVEHTITVRNDNGTISAEPAAVADGGSSTVTWSGLEGFVLDSVLVDGTVISTDEYTDNGDGTYSYTFENVVADHSVQVNYKPDSSSDPENTNLYIYTHIDNGTITPTVTIADDAGKAYQLIEWSAEEGYRVTKVLVDNAALPNAENEGSVEFNDIDTDHTVSVECEKIPVFIIATDGKNVTSITPTNASVLKGGEYTVEWTPADGMVLKTFLVDNKAVELEEGAVSYTFENVSANHSVYVEYGAENEPAQPDKLEISVMVTNGTKTGGGTVNYGTKSHTVTWTPNDGYEVKSVVIDSVELAEGQFEKTGGSITFTDIVSDHSVVVVCGASQSGEEPADEKVYLEANILNGIFDPDSEFGVYQIEKGSNFEISWTPSEGYKVVSVKLDGIERADLMADGKLTLIGVSGDHALTVECRDESDMPADDKGPFTITTSIDHGTISESFTTSEGNDAYTVSWTVDSKYEIVSVMVDGNPYANASDGYITFNPITANHTVDVRSQLKDQPVDSYVIDIIVDNGGTHALLVDGNVVDYVAKGGSAKATWQAADGYDITRIVIDGVSYNSLPGCDEQSGEYTFNNVAKDHEIIVYTSKHVEKEPVYYSITVVPYGNPNGLELSDSLPSVLEGTEAAVKWSAKPGFRIDKVTRNGNTMSAEDIAAGMTDEGFKFTVNANNDFVVYVSENGPVDDSFVYVSTEIENGWISNSGSVKKGSSFDVTWRPNDGYVVEEVLVTDAEGNEIAYITEGLGDPANWKYAFSSVTGNTTVKVVCVKQPDGEEPIIYSYQISTEATNGTVTGGGTVTAGADKEITWAPAAGCVIESIKLYKVDRDGGREEIDVSSVTPDGNGVYSYTIQNIASDYLVELVCKNEAQSDTDYFYDINTAITNGTINGPFLNLRKNGQATVSWTPNDDCYVKEVKVDGKTVAIPADNQLEVLVEGEDHTVEVICEKNQPVEIPDGVTPFVIKSYIYDGSGDITPEIKALPGSNATVQWKVDTNNHYKVDRVYIDGESVEVPANNTIFFENIDADHTVEVYLTENLVTVEVSYEGDGDVVKSGTVYWGEEFGIVRGVPNEGYRLESVILNGRLLQKGEIIEELLPDPDMPLPGEEIEGQSLFSRAVMALASVFSARADYSRYTENEFQNTFYFYGVTEKQTVKYVFVDDNGATDYAPYQVSVELVEGRGDRDVTKNVAAGTNTSIGWVLEEGYYIDHISIVRNDLETDINDLDDAQLEASGNSVSLQNIQANTVVKVYAKRGTPPDPMDANDFSLSIDVVGPGSNDPDIRVYGAGKGMAAGDHEASWDVGEHKVTMVKVDGVVREDLIGEYSTTITMNREDVVRDHFVVVYLDGTVLPGLEKSAGDSRATVGDIIPYTISIWNDTDQAIWENVTLSDTIPEGLDIDVSTLKLYSVDADGNKTEVTNVPVTYDAATRTVTADLGDIGKTDKYELSFDAEVNIDAAGKDIGNSVHAAGTTSGTDEDDPGHVVEKETGRVYPGGTESVLPAAPAPHVTKKVESSDPNANNTRVGDILTYTIDVWNSAAGSVWKSVRLKDDIPDGLEMREDSIELVEIVGENRVPVTSGVSVQYDATNRTLSANLGDLDCDKHYQISFEVRVLAEAVGSDIGNLAIAAGTAPDKTPVSEETDPVYPKEPDKPENGGVLPAAPKPLIYKTVVNYDRSNEQSMVGDKLEYTVTVKNDMFDSVWKNAVVRDRIPEGIEIDTENIILRTADADTVLDPAVYDAESRMLSVYLGDIGYEDQYQLIFTAEITGSVLDYDIGNIAWANGKDPSVPGGNDPVPGVDDDTKPGDPYFEPDGDDDWVDEGGPTTDKVYPNEEDRPTAPGPKLTKTSRNTTHPVGDAEYGDIIEYEIEIANTQYGSSWKNVTVVDTLPEQLTPEAGGFMLIHPDGTAEQLNMMDAYDYSTHSITVVLPDSVRSGGTYWLRYRACIVEPNGTQDVPEEVINRVAATGTDVDGNMISMEASNAIAYPQPVIDEPIEDPLPYEPDPGIWGDLGFIRTGDDADVVAYVFWMLASAALCAAVIRYGVKKGKKKD